MKLFLILATAITLVAASRSYRTSNHNHHSRHSERDRRANLDYEDIETADQDQVERFDEANERKLSNRIGVYSTVHTLQIAKNKAAQRRHSKLQAAKDSEAQGTHYDGAHYGNHYASPQQQVQQIHTHELLTSQGLVPIYQNQVAGAPTAGGIQGIHGLQGIQGLQGLQGHNIVLTGGLGVSGGLGINGLADGGHAPFIVAGDGGGGHPHHHHQLIAANPQIPQPVAAGPPVVENDLGADITKSVYVFSAPPDPFDYVQRPTITKLPQRHQKHYQVIFVNSPAPPPAPQHHVELPPPPELKTLVYVLVKKNPPPAPINFIKGPPHLQAKPEVYFIRYKNREVQ